MAKDPNYGETIQTPALRVYYGSIQEPDKFSDVAKPQWNIKVEPDLDNPEHVKMLKVLTDFENERRLACGAPQVEMTSAYKETKNKKTGVIHKILRLNTYRAPQVFNADGQATADEAMSGDTVTIAGVPKYVERNIDGKPLLTLYLNEVRIDAKGTGGGSTGGSLLGKPLSEVQVEGIQLPKVADEAPQEDNPVDLSSIKLNV